VEGLLENGAAFGGLFQQDQLCTSLVPRTRGDLNCIRRSGTSALIQRTQLAYMSFGSIQLASSYLNKYLEPTTPRRSVIRAVILSCTNNCNKLDMLRSYQKTTFTADHSVGVCPSFSHISACASSRLSMMPLCFQNQITLET
jgi:hypothetical protein